MYRRVRCMVLPIVGCTLDWKFNSKIQSNPINWIDSIQSKSNLEFVNVDRIGALTQSNPIEFVNAPNVFFQQNQNYAHK